MKKSMISSLLKFEIFAIKFLADLLSASESNCLTPCATMDIIFGIPIISVDIDKNNPKQSTMKMYFKKMIQVRRSYLAYSIISMFAEIGGYLGLLLGYSLLDLTNILNKIFNWLKMMKMI